MSRTVMSADIQLNCPATGGPHRFTVVVETMTIDWPNPASLQIRFPKGYHVTVLRCEFCPEEVSR